MASWSQRLGTTLISTAVVGSASDSGLWFVKKSQWHSTAATRNAQILLWGCFFFLSPYGWSAAGRLLLELKSADRDRGDRDRETPGRAWQEWGAASARALSQTNPAELSPGGALLHNEFRGCSQLVRSQSVSPRGNCDAPAAPVCSSPDRMLLWTAMQPAALCSLQWNQCLQNPNCTFHME